MMNKPTETKANQRIAEYNDQCAEEQLKSLVMGSLKRPRGTLADISGLAVNDNVAKGE